MVSARPNNLCSFYWNRTLNDVAYTENGSSSTFSALQAIKKKQTNKRRNVRMVYKSTNRCQSTFKKKNTQRIAHSSGRKSVLVYMIVKYVCVVFCLMLEIFHQSKWIFCVQIRFIRGQNELSHSSIKIYSLQPCCAETPNHLHFINIRRETCHEL